MKPCAGALLALGLGVWLGVGAAWADAVPVTFALEPGHEDKSVSWSATPLDLPMDVDIIAAMIMEPGPIAGPWQVALEPGSYLVSAFSEADVFELTVVVEANANQSYNVPALNLTQQVAYHCKDAPICRFQDEETGISFALPQGWGAEQPYFADLGTGEVAAEVSGVFFEDVESEGAAVWFLNPVDWIEDDNGPCLEVPIGILCSFEIGPAAQAGFDVIAPSLAVGPSGP